VRKVKIIRNPKSLDAAVDEAIRQTCREGSTSVEATACWQPRLFSEQGDDAIVYVTTKR
jgi:hypothetical protein